MHQKIEFSTKAQTLSRIKGSIQSASIPNFCFYTRQDWAENSSEILRLVKEQFLEKKVSVRSSSINEDNATSSNAGAFKTIHNINPNDKNSVFKAIQEVFASMPNSPKDEVLVQEFVEEIKISGVLMTHDAANGAPYYHIEYDDESGNTESVTSGFSNTKAITIFRDSCISRIKIPFARKLIELAHELEQVFCENALDIEFCINSQNEVILLQVRRIALSNEWQNLAKHEIRTYVARMKTEIADRLEEQEGFFGRNNIFGIMPDWNPAEIIGRIPTPLSLSLYSFLISEDVWRVARATMGYKNVGKNPLFLIYVANHL